MHKVSELTSRYRQPREIIDVGDNTYRIQGPALSYRVGEGWFDPEGGPWIGVGNNMGFGVISKLKIISASEGYFIIEVEVVK